jgi:hypothetical protein
MDCIIREEETAKELQPKYTVTCSSSATYNCGFRIWWLDFF